MHPTPSSCCGVVLHRQAELHGAPIYLARVHHVHHNLHQRMHCGWAFTRLPALQPMGWTFQVAFHGSKEVVVGRHMLRYLLSSGGTRHGVVVQGAVAQLIVKPCCVATDASHAARHVAAARWSDAMQRVRHVGRPGCGRHLGTRFIIIVRFVGKTRSQP